MDSLAGPSTTDTPLNTRTAIGTARRYRTTSFISAAWTFLPRYSGVRPTMRPEMNTARSTKMSMPYRPAPTPPGETSPSSMLTSGTAPPPGVKLSCEEITAPVDVPVVEAAKSAEVAAPKRTSLPSMLAAPASTRGFPWVSKYVAVATEPAHRANIAKKIAQPWRWSLTRRPKA